MTVREYPAAVAWRSGRADVDIAVLGVPDLPALPPLSCARVNTGIAARIEDCVALGFPKWNDRASAKRRAQADGYVGDRGGRRPACGGRGTGIVDVQDHHPGDSGQAGRSR